MNKISQTINESCFSCQNIGQISILVILVVSKCSIYDVKNPISPIFRGPQTPHIATIFEKILQTILFYINESACHIFVTICNTFRFSTVRPFFHPSDQKVIFSSNHNSKRGFPFNLYMINIDGSGLKQITYDTMFDAFPVFSNDGKKIVFSSNRNNGGTRETNLFIADWKE